MFHGLSRRTLNALIIGCLLIITTINLSMKNSEDTPLEAIKAAPLPANVWIRWQTHEGGTGVMQSSASEQLTIIVRGHEKDLMTLTLSPDRWADDLKQQASGKQVTEPAVVAIKGPLNEPEMHQLAAWISAELNLQPPAQSYSQCQLAYPAAALWWNRQKDQPAFSAVQTMPPEQWPAREEWQVFRSEELKQLRRQWLSEHGSIDIALDLAYHRAPDDYLERLYRDLATAQKTAPQAMAECLKNTPASGSLASE